MKRKAKVMQTEDKLYVAHVCHICGLCGTSLVYLGLDTWRHEECAPGSYSWCRWYERQPKSKRNADLDLLYTPDIPERKNHGKQHTR
jgi:hypothetical protein